MTAPQLKPTHSSEEDKENLCLFAQTDFRNQMRRFGIKTDDRRRHMYVVGKTGMGKTTMMENMVLHDIYNGHGVGIVDPHGDFAEKIINYIPPHRINDVVYFNPADTSFPIGFNILEVKNDEQKHLVASGLMATFKKIWPDVWSSRMEYILNNTLLALLDYPGSTLLGINRLLADKAYRKKVISKLKDPVVKAFWQNEFASYNDRYAQEAVAPIQNKIGQFLSASVIRNMVAQVKSTINIREIMDGQKIFVMNLSKGRIGEDNSRLLGGMLITEIQLAAMERVDTPEHERKDFFLYVDEFQNFATPSFANILSEARKYRLSLIMAHQYIKQLDEIVGDAVFGNVGTIVTFRVGGPDAEVLVKEFTPTFMEEDIVNLEKFHIFLKLMINGVASLPFSAMTMPPIGSPTGSAEKVIKVSRERYAKDKSSIEDKITRWSGMEPVESQEEEFDVDTTKRPPKKKESSKTISLSDLKPKENNPPKDSSKKTSSQKPKEERSSASDRPKGDKGAGNSSAGLGQENKNGQAVSGGESHDSEKKKRKRKRKKKSEGQNNASSTNNNGSQPKPEDTQKSLSELQSSKQIEKTNKQEEDSPEKQETTNTEYKIKDSKQQVADVDEKIEYKQAVVENKDNQEEKNTEPMISLADLSEKKEDKPTENSAPKKLDENDIISFDS